MFFYPFGFNMAYILLVVVSLVLGIATQSYIKSTYNKWSKVPLGNGKTGAEVAREMLAAYDVSGVDILATGGQELDDYYNPRDNTLHLSDTNMKSSSVASAAVACHEAGHACQHAQDYLPERVRGALVPAVNFASNAWIFVFILGVFMNVVGLVQLAIILFIVTFVFSGSYFAS